uniref:upstream stimulatory factor 2-like n=1 Tax=Myodes glareolus TaxID=447135 RepID=UPI0020207B33|nr:upstream stimulatory factor 2-like [Myodes glareolus]
MEIRGNHINDQSLASAWLDHFPVTESLSSPDVTALTHPCSPKIGGTRTPRDERRRAQHNEAERRRRDKINNWIVQLSKTIPDCHADNSKTGASKGGILSKAWDYIQELRQTNQPMQETFKDPQRLQMDNELLRQQTEELKNENALLRAQLQQHNLEMVSESTRQ